MYDLVGIADRFIDTELDENGILKSIEYKNDEKFNFAYDVIDVMAKKCPDKLAMLHISLDGRERRFTFRDMAKYSNMAANYFSYLGIKKGDKVMLVLKRHFQFWFSLLALHKIGAIAIPATNLLTKKDFEYRFKVGEVDAIVCTADGEVSREVDKAAWGNTNLKTKIMVGGARESWHCFNKDIRFFSANFTRPADAVGGDDTMLMFFTSGTTSYPKITTHNHKYPLGHYITAKYWHQVDPNGIHFAISDTGWGKALWGKIYGQWICEAPIFTYDFDDFDAKKILQMIEKYKITTFCAPPTAYRVMVHLKLENYDLSSLQNVTTAGEALNPKVFEKFKEKTGFDIMEGFGQTETTMLIGTIKGMTPRPGSMGKPSPLYDIAIMRADGTFADPGEEGEIVVKTEDGVPNGLFKGYYNDVEKTESVWYNGYYHTGDTAYMDEDGYLWYVGRVDDVIKSSGYRIGPFEIENEIMKLPYVLECAVTSVPDRLRGQAIKATVVLADGTEGDEHLRNDIVKYLKSNIASYKWPKIVDFAKELPKTISGKVRRVEIKENDWAASEEEATETTTADDGNEMIEKADVNNEEEKNED
nr:AMP-binding protein [Eubacterium sp.]